MKVRDGSPLDVPMMLFGWDKTEDMHVYRGEKSKEDKENARPMNSCLSSICIRTKLRLSYQELCEVLTREMEIKDRTAKKVHCIYERAAYFDTRYKWKLSKRRTMPYLNDTSETDWCKRLFDKLKTVEYKLDQLLVLQEQSVDTNVHPPLKPEYLDIIDVSKNLESGAKNHLQLGMVRENSLPQS